MNPKLLFWVPALLRLGLLFAFAGLVWWWMGLVAGLSLALAAAVTAIIVQLSYLQKLGEWLEHPQETRLPDGWAPGPKRSRACTTCGATTRSTRPS